MQERDGRNPTVDFLINLGVIVLPSWGFIGTIATALNYQEVIDRASEFPLSAGRLLQITSDAGIHPYVTLAALGALFTTEFVVGRRLTRSR